MSDQAIEPVGTGPEAPGPADYADPVTQRELKKAVVWVAVLLVPVLVYVLAEPLFLILGGVVFASMLDGGTRLLGRVLPIGRGWRLGIVALLVTVSLLGFFALAGTQVAGQAAVLQKVVTGQADRLLNYAHNMGVLPPNEGVGSIGKQLMGSLGKVTAAVSTALGAVSSMAMIVVIGLFVAMEPRLYERGLAWMFPMRKRGDFYRTADAMGKTLRRLMAGRLAGMAIEGIFVGIALTIIGVPMAPLLGILTGLLAFLPNIGAIVSGALIVLVGFSAGSTTGIWACVVYGAVQMFDGYVIVPMVARRAVDLPPALVLGMQLLLGALFGILGLALADPLVAMTKVLLEERSEQAAEEAGDKPAVA
jgi:predicted PurR-regulated permease PerM